MRARRRLPVGAEPLAGVGVDFRVWAPRHNRVEVVVEDEIGGDPVGAFRLVREAQGYFSGRFAELGAGTLYRYRLDREDALYPDPASRFQPAGPHGPSQVIDPSTFRWSDGEWQGLPLEGQVIYELHVGTFTPEGTWRSAALLLPDLAAIGISVIEMMPVAEFPGRFGWGYDGVDLFAPSHLYGEPDDLRHFVDTAHRTGIGVVLDVVYNHFGPSGNYLAQFSPDYFTDRYDNEWGDPINFDGTNARPVREFFLANAGYWINEFHFDGLRLDATQQIFDASADHIVTAIARKVRQSAGTRRTLLIAENEPQRAALVRPVPDGGFGLDAIWNDDFHHAARVAVTGRREAYYSDYLGTPQELVSTAKRGFLFQGQRSAWQNKRRGSPTFGILPSAFVNYLQNHDQIANSASGGRLHQQTSPGRYRAITALLLLGPGTPMLFQGQEFAASTPFLYFADHEPDLAEAVRKGRTQFLRQFPSIATPETERRLNDPADPATFTQSKLKAAERTLHAEAKALHRDLLRLRREDPVIARQGAEGLDGAVLTATAFVVRYFTGDGRDRLLIVNLGRDLQLEPIAEPLLAPPEGKRWRVHWSSEDPGYGGSGSPAEEASDGWHVPGEAAVLMVPVEGGDESETGGEHGSGEEHASGGEAG